MTEKQQEIISDIMRERLSQDAEYGGAAHDDLLDAHDWVAILCKHVGLAGNDGHQPFDAVRFRRQMVRVAAVAMAALESFDRQNKPEGKTLVIRERGSGA